MSFFSHACSSQNPGVVERDGGWGEAEALGEKLDLVVSPEGTLVLSDGATRFGWAFGWAIARTLPPQGGSLHWERL